MHKTSGASPAGGARPGGTGSRPNTFGRFDNATVNGAVTNPGARGYGPSDEGGDNSGDPVRPEPSDVRGRDSDAT